MKFLIICLACFCILTLSVLVTAFWLVSAAAPKIKSPRDIFGFASIKPSTADAEISALKRYAARDGQELAYRIYDSSSDRILIFIHGSSYQGAGYHALATS